MTTVAEVLNQARSWLGTTEQPPGSNNVPGITDWYGLQGPWCNMFISRILTDAGIPHHCGYVPTEVQNAIDGVDGFQLVARADIQAGDLLAHNFPGGVAYDHIDIVEARDSDTLNCIDGNWEDACMRVIRHVSDVSIAAVIRPPYSILVPPAPPPVPVEEDFYAMPLAPIVAMKFVQSTINDWYKEALGRVPDPDEMYYWVRGDGGNNPGLLNVVNAGSDPWHFKEQVFIPIAKWDSGYRGKR